MLFYGYIERGCSLVKILYNDDFQSNFKSFNEIYYISSNYEQIKKTGYLGRANHILKYLIIFIVYSLLSFLYLDLIFNDENKQFIVVTFAILFVLFSLIYLLALLGFFLQYSAKKKMLKLKKNKKKSTLTINEEGIKDNTNDICISSTWNNINCVVIGKYSVCILTEAMIYYVFPITIKDKLLSGINKYNTNKNIKIIKKELEEN